MKTRLQFLTIFSFLILTFSNSYSLPLNGAYTVGSGGDYPTIVSAVNDAENEGIIGPVIFNILTGIYNESVSITFIPGSSPLNTLTIKSFSGISSEVQVNSVTIMESNISIENLSFNNTCFVSEYPGFINNINIINNDFRNFGLSVFAPPGVRIRNLKILGNINVASMDFIWEMHISQGNIDTVHIKNNIINGSIKVYLCYNFLIEGNTISGGMDYGSESFKIIENKINGRVITRGELLNNFINGELYYYGYGDVNRCINNTIVGGTIDTPTVHCTGNNNLNYLNYFQNNIIINPEEGTAIDFPNYTVSDYNVYYNGGNNGLILNQGSTYNTVSDFYNASGLDEHSTSQPVSFVSPTDLHLASLSYGDFQLIGIPDPSVTDDIDGDLRNPLYPYKGADEIVDFPLPVELAAFTSIVTKNTVNLNWITTFELNNTGFDIERSTINTPITNEWLKVGFVQGNGTSSNTNIYEFTDKNLNPGKYSYRLKQIDFNGNFKYYILSREVIVGIPEKYSLNQNYPNPFNPITVISYQIPNNNNVLLKIYDINGKEVMTLVNEFKEAGSYEIKFNGSNFASGVYYYQIESGDFRATKKMFLVK